MSDTGLSENGFPLTNGVETLLPPPEGYVVDFDNPRQQYALEHYIIFGVFGPIALIALLQRYYTKIWLSKGLQADDAFMFLAWAASIVTQSILVYSVSQGGMCAHAWEMPLSRFEEYSVKWFRIAVWVSIVIVALYTAVLTLLMIFHCNPVQKAFNFRHQGGSCLNVAVLYIATAVSNILTDVLLFILPIPMVLHLRMSWAQKVGAIIIFGIGSMTVATSIVRLVYLPPILVSNDPSWDAAFANLWTFLEANLFIICGSMPTLRKFFKHFAPRLMGQSSSSPSYGGYGGGNGYGYASRLSAATQSRIRKGRKQYEPFPESSIENDMHLDTMPRTRPGSDPELEEEEQQQRRRRRRRHAGAVSVSVQGGKEATVQGFGDDHSERAILQTKSFVVRYEDGRPT